MHSVLCFVWGFSAFFLFVFNKSATVVAAREIVGTYCGCNLNLRQFLFAKCINNPVLYLILPLLGCLLLDRTTECFIVAPSALQLTAPWWFIHDQWREVHATCNTLTSYSVPVLLTRLVSLMSSHYMFSVQCTSLQ